MNRLATPKFCLRHCFLTPKTIFYRNALEHRHAWINTYSRSCFPETCNKEEISREGFLIILWIHLETLRSFEWTNKIISDNYYSEYRSTTSLLPSESTRDTLVSTNPSICSIECSSTFMCQECHISCTFQPNLLVYSYSGMTKEEFGEVWTPLKLFLRLYNG